VLACAMTMTTMNIFGASVGGGGKIGGGDVALSLQEALSHLTATFGVF